ncbi:MAG: GDP-mannose 4,6-dehydratase [Pirellulaceae bacterium]|nr:GDP-mannose 4,6-dehydratase [Pirellulaceae bacterium]
MSRKALILGITGQDGSYLAELLLDKGYQVHGLVRRSSNFSTARIDHLYRDSHSDPPLKLHYGDLTDGQALAQLIQEIAPDEIYNLAAQSHVRVSFDLPVYTLMTVGLGALNVLEAARRLNDIQPVRVYQASSSEMFGRALETPQRESTPFNPQSPYACSKVYAHFQTQNYRVSHGLFACCGILFNHESPRRGETFVTRKITRAATRIKLGLQNKLYLGNLEARRDWGFAKDYVESMWLMLQHERPDDYVIATGRSATIAEFLEMVFGQLDLDWRQYVEIDPYYFRPSEVDCLIGDASKAQQVLNWQPQTSLEQLAELMTASDLELAQKELSSGALSESNP